MSNATIGERRDRHHKAQRKRGLVLVQLWVPAASRDDLRAYAKVLRHEHGVGDLTATGRPRKARKGR